MSITSFASKQLIHFALFLLASQEVSICVHSLSVLNGSVVYYDGLFEVDLPSNLALCSEGRGHLAIVHSREDIDRITAIIGNGWIWLGANFENKSSSSPIDEYKWIDDTPFDYKNWAKGEPTCQSACCGISLAKGQMFTEDCYVRNRPFCIIPQFDDPTVRTWLKSRMTSESTVEYFSLINFEQQLINSKLINETLDVLTKTKKLLEERKNQIKSSSRTSSPPNAPHPRSQMNLIEKQTISTRNKSRLDSLAFRVDLFLGLLVFIFFIQSLCRCEFVSSIWKKLCTSHPPEAANNQPAVIPSSSSRMPSSEPNVIYSVSQAEVKLSRMSSVSST